MMKTYSFYLYIILLGSSYNLVIGCPPSCTCTNTNSMQKASCTNVVSLQGVVMSLDVSTSYLEILSTKINSLSPTDFDGITAIGLETLILRDCYINQIYDATFSELSNLRNLNLSHNSISSISMNAFSGLDDLHTLDLSSNRITSIGEEFVPLIHLQLLDLSTNYLTNINSGVFRMLARLQTLSLNGNKLENLHGDSLKGLVSLKTLNLRNCDLTIIRSDLFSNLRIIKKLDVGNNRIVVLPMSEVFIQNAQYLNTLLVDGNQIESLSNNQFSGMNTDKLNLARNRIRTIPYGVFDHLDVTELDLSENAINSIHRHAFRQIASKLTKLNLAGNSLGSIPSGSLDNLYRLQYLNLSMCALRQLTTNEFGQLHYLKNLDLSRNRLTYIPQPVLDSFNRLSQVNIEQNTWNCDCRIVPFRKWLSTSNVGKMHCSKMYSLDCRSPKCSSPSLLAGQIIRLTDKQELKCEKYIDRDRLSTTQVIGISIGCVIGVTLLVAALIICIRYSQGKITLSCNDSQISSHELGEKDRSSKPFHDADVGSLDESDKSFVVRNFFHSMDPDPSAISQGSPELFHKEVDPSCSRSYSSLNSVGYNPMGRESAV